MPWSWFFFTAKKSRPRHLCKHDSFFSYVLVSFVHDYDIHQECCVYTLFWVSLLIGILFCVSIYHIFIFPVVLCFFVVRRQHGGGGGKKKKRRQHDHKQLGRLPHTSPLWKEVRTGIWMQELKHGPWKSATHGLSSHFC